MGPVSSKSTARNKSAGHAWKTFDINLDLIPVPFAERLCVFLSVSDVINLSRTCKFWYRIINSNSTWKGMVAHRYGQEAVEMAYEDSKLQRDAQEDGIKDGGDVSLCKDEASSSSGFRNYGRALSLDEHACATPQVDFKTYYFQLASVKKSVLDMAVTWLNDHYLVKEEEVSSPFQHVVHLRNVCWLHIDTHFKRVLPGKYKLLWHLKLHNVNIGGETRHMAIPEAGCGKSLEKKISENKWKSLETKNVSGQWFMEDFGAFTVTKTCDVRVQVINTENPWWKNGIWWDYAEIKQIF